MSASEEKALKTKTMADSDELISPVVSNAPEFVITRASVNAEPAELDGKPISREEQEHKNHAASPEHEEVSVGKSLDVTWTDETHSYGKS